MATNQYPPGAEAALITAVNTVHDVAVLNPSNYATTSAALAILSTKSSDFVTKYDICQVPSTRTKPAIEAKDASKEDLLAYFRPLVRSMTNATTMDNTKRAALGIPLREAPSPIDAPEDPPVTEISEMNGWTAKVKVRPAGSEGRSSIADGAIQVYVYSYVGATPPGNVSEWKFEGPSSKAIFDVTFAPELTFGTKVWVCCQWVTARGLTSPACAPIALLIGGGVPEVGAA